MCFLTNSQSNTWKSLRLTLTDWHLHWKAFFSPFFTLEEQLWENWGPFTMKLVDMSGNHISATESSQQKKLRDGLGGSLDLISTQRRPVSSSRNPLVLRY